MSAAVDWQALRDMGKPEGPEHPEHAQQCLSDAARRLRRIILLVEAAEAHLDQLRGCELDRDDVLEVLGMIAEQAQAVMLPELQAQVAP